MEALLFAHVLQLFQKKLSVRLVPVAAPAPVSTATLLTLYSAQQNAAVQSSGGDCKFYQLQQLADVSHTGFFFKSRQK